MPKIESFETCHHRYDAWFQKHEAAYYSELLGVRAMLPWRGMGLEIGVGSGRFAAPLGVRFGVDPSGAMLEYAAKRGLVVVQGTAEALPLADASFDYALIVMTICFVDDVCTMLAETGRVLKQDGQLVIGFIDRNSSIGRHYQAHKEENVFYREARFYSVGEVERLLYEAGFSETAWCQTLHKPLGQIREIDPVRPGCGQGAFVVVRATRHRLEKTLGAPRR